jgi:hypothetical protein
MKEKHAVIRLSIPLALIVILTGLGLHPFASAAPPMPTPTPEKIWLQLDPEAPEQNPLSQEYDARASEGESSWISAAAQETFYSIADAEIREGYPVNNYGNSTLMRCGYDDSYEPDGRIMRCLIKFDISSLPSGSTINNAKLYVYLVGSWDYPGQTRTYTTYRIASNWSESTITWNNAPSYAQAYGSTGVTHEAWGWYSFDVTNLVRAWYNGTYPNYGIMLRGPEWSGSDSSWKAFSTEESGAPPYLVVDYDYIPPTLGASPTLLRFYAYGTGPNPDPQAVKLSNITGGSLNWSAAKVGGAPWLSLDKTSGSVTPSSPDTMNVSVSTSGLAYGTYTERIAITRTGAPTECSNRTVDVVLEYKAGPPPGERVFLPIITKTGGEGASRDAVALVVGVAQYPYFAQAGDVRAGGDPTQLQYTDDDARDIRDTTVNLAGFSSGNVILLINSNATKASIESAINQLDARENKNTLVVVSFSGHGGQVPDVAPYDEVDGYDEFIAPYDTTLTGDNIILDDELDEWLSRLESEHVVVAVDSCNSGGMIDYAGVATGRGIGFVLKTQGVVAQVAEADGLAADINKKGRVVLVASRTDQESWEFGALNNGVFSYYFVEGFSSTIADGDGNGRISAEEAFSYLECRVDNYVYGHTGDVPGGPYNQNPQLYDGTIGEEWITQP